MTLNLTGAPAEIAIDFGTANLRMIHREGGVIFDEPSLCCLTGLHDQPRFVAAGAPVQAMTDRTPVGMRVRRPLSRGVLQDIGAATHLLRYAASRAIKRRAFRSPRVMIGLPADVTQAERNAMLIAARDAALNPVCFVPEPLAAAIGANLEIDAPQGAMIVDCGAGTTEVALLSLGRVCLTRSLRGGGAELDAAIIDYIHARYKLLVGRSTAERVKYALGEACARGAAVDTIEVKGRSLVSGLPAAIRIPPIEFADVIERHAQHIVELILELLAETPPELSKDIHGRGILLTGGGAATPALREKIAAGTGLRVTIAEDSGLCVARGLLKILQTDLAAG